MHRWLLADLSRVLAPDASPEDRRIARLRCHLGQPVKLATASGAVTGALRLCASGRILADAGASTDALARMLAEAEAAIDKAAFVLAHLDRLSMPSPDPLAPF